MTTGSTQDLACKEVVELVTDYLEQTLSHDERTRFEQHLALCGGCKEYLREIRSTIDLSRKLAEGSLAPKVRDDLLNLFRNWKAG
jgi:anti-sigma factor RsiW